MEIIVDNIRSASNIGSIFRTSDAFAIHKIYICGISAVPPNKEILKTALGSTENIAWDYHSSTIELIKQLKKDGNNFIVAVEQSKNSEALQDFNPNSSHNIIIVMGNEVEGISSEVLDLVNTTIEIPQFGKKKSLNVSVATGIAVWEIFKKLNLSKPSV